MPSSKLQSQFVIPPSDHRTTFGEDENLPSLPLPNIEHTLARYLDSLKPFTSAEEYSKSERVVKLFEESVGRLLHEKLENKARKERNWVEKWWETFAYLQIRLPLIPYCSMDSVFPRNISDWSYGSEEDQIKHASLYCYYMMQFWWLLRRERLVPAERPNRKIKFSMSQFRRLFNTTRLPGEKIDSLVSFFKTEGACPSNIIVIHKGRLFCLNGVDPDGIPIGPLQWAGAFREIIKICKEPENKAGLPVLTCDSRTNWSQNRQRLERLSQRNREMLGLIDKSTFVVVLDDASPETDSDVSNCNLSGDYMNRWTDKSMSLIFYKNGRSGSINDHTAFDGMVGLVCQSYVFTALLESKNEWEKEGKKTFVPEVQELKFDMDEIIENEINRVQEGTSLNRKEILMTRVAFEDFGKLEIQRLKFHPDSFVQMCLQLAYFDIYRKPAACYETATTRKFYNGRTETLRCCTTQCMDWVASMLDPKCTKEQRAMLFVKATKRHHELMNEAKENAGCDRHLFGMYCTALEEGIEIPDLFLDPAYLKSGGGGNFVLSTSCVGFTPLGGGVAPMCRDGYGVFYNIIPNEIHFTISVNCKSNETDAGKFFESLKKALRQTREMLLSVGATKSKF